MSELQAKASSEAKFAHEKAFDDAVAAYDAQDACAKAYAAYATYIHNKDKE